MQVASINASGHKYGELAVVQQAIRLSDTRQSCLAVHLLPSSRDQAA